MCCCSCNDLDVGHQFTRIPVYHISPDKMEIEMTSIAEVEGTGEGNREREGEGEAESIVKNGKRRKRKRSSPESCSIVDTTTVFGADYHRFLLKIAKTSFGLFFKFCDDAGIHNAMSIAGDCLPNNLVIGQSAAQSTEN